MTYQDTTSGPCTVESIESALAALGIRLENTAWDGPAIVAGQLLAGVSRGERCTAAPR
ncbi:hypothetical protein [Streptomyces venezuelae]|uniref:hypothetical protein n=1 Tax=Streptomyces venezuelae TaxID=54571 RepID=UPI00332F2ECB